MCGSSIVAQSKKILVPSKNFHFAFLFLSLLFVSNYLQIYESIILVSISPKLSPGRTALDIAQEGNEDKCAALLMLCGDGFTDEKHGNTCVLNLHKNHFFFGKDVRSNDTFLWYKIVKTISVQTAVSNEILGFANKEVVYWWQYWQYFKNKLKFSSFLTTMTN